TMFDVVLGVAVAVALSAAVAWLPQDASFGRQAAVADTIEISAAEIDYPLPGEFLAEGRAVAAPVETKLVRPFHIMRQLVGAADYGRCVSDGGCRPAAARTAGGVDVPITGVSHLDAAAYAAWYSKQTGQAWRLPTAEEWAAAAG